MSAPSNAPRTLTERQAFDAMKLFLEAFWRRCGADDASLARHSELGRMGLSDLPMALTAIISFVAVIALVGCTAGMTETSQAQMPDRYKKVYEWTVNEGSNCQPHAAAGADISLDGKLVFFASCTRDADGWGAGEGNLIFVDLTNPKPRVLLKSYAVGDPRKTLPTAHMAKFLPDGRILIACKVGASDSCGTAATQNRPQTLIAIVDPLTGKVTPVEWLDGVAALYLDVRASDGFAFVGGNAFEGSPGDRKPTGQRQFVYTLQTNAGKTTLRRQNSPPTTDSGCRAPFHCMLRDESGLPLIAELSDPYPPDPLENHTVRYKRTDGQLSGSAIAVPFNARQLAFDPYGGRLFVAWYFPDLQNLRSAHPPIASFVSTEADPTPFPFELRDNTTGEVVFTAPRSGDVPDEAAFVDEDTLALAFGMRNRLEVWDTKSLKLVQSIPHRVDTTGIGPELFSSEGGRYVGWASHGRSILVLRDSRGGLLPVS